MNNTLDWNKWFVGFCDGQCSFTFSCRAATRSARPRFKLCLQEDAELIQEVRSRFGFGSAPGEFIPKALRNGIAYAPRAEWHVDSASDCLKLVEFFRAYPLRSHKRADFAIWSDLVAEVNSPTSNRHQLNTIALRLSETRASGNSRKAQATLRQWLGLSPIATP
jgi:hypothetical protein